MNILISTTLGHNPGDEIILKGVKRLLAAKFGDEITYISYNRNPDLQTRGLCNERVQRTDLVGNYMTSGSILKHVDMVVLAGSPEWYGGPMEALYKAIEKYTLDIPLLALGIGLGSEWGTLSVLDKRVLSRPQTKIITRSKETSQMLMLQLGINVPSLVCPALFAFTGDEPECFWNRATVAKLLASKTLLILQKPGNGWHEIRESCLEGLHLKDRQRDEDILCLHIKEYEYFMEMFEWEKTYHKRVYYAADPASFAEVVSRYSKVVSTRLHGAIGALSLGIPAVVVSNGDFRIETCSSMFGNVLPRARTISEGLEVARFILPTERAKRGYFDAYMKALDAP